MSQMKEQNKTPEKELNKMHTSNLPDAEFQTLVIRMFNKLRERVNELIVNFNKEIGNIKMEIENIKNNQSKIKNTLSKMKNTLMETNSGVDEAENKIIPGR